ncbi:hypothetical protein BH10PSE14_BH10PSE14_06140 [soil metagenome]
MSGEREATMFLDATGKEIRLGDVVRAPIDINQSLHGTWGEYRIRKAPGGYLLSYLRSEKGQILPEGYTGGYMADCIPRDDETDLKTLVFTQVPVQVSSWRIVDEPGAAVVA